MRDNFNNAPTEWGDYILGNASCSRGTLLPRFEIPKHWIRPG